MKNRVLEIARRKLEYRKYEVGGYLTQEEILQLIEHDGLKPLDSQGPINKGDKSQVPRWYYFKKK